jgi:dipeptide/tripeptide permease
MNTEEKTPLLTSFPRVFWLANVMELFERAAYYGMNSVLAIYLTNSAVQGGLGFSEQSVGFLQSLVYAMTYVVPILGGALADRYGYRRMLLVAFALLTTGYYITGHVSTYGIVFTSLLLLATGAGLFKPIISGTLARTTTPANSGFGFGIYYWMINLGAFLAPLLVSYLKGFSWSLVFTISALYCALMLLPTLFLYRDPPKPANSKSLTEVLGGAAMVLGDARFMLMILVYSCFWILYFQNFGSVLWFMRDFIDKAPVNDFFARLGIPFSFDVEHVTVINAGTIILLQVVISRLYRNRAALSTMVVGLFFGSLGFFCLAFAVTPWIFILGLVIFSIGEMTAHPKYYSYVGLIAPADKKAIYMGYAFLYGVIGSLVGSNLGGLLYGVLLKPHIGSSSGMAMSRKFWLFFALLGLVSMAGLALYNRFLGEDTAVTRKRAHRIMSGVYGLLLAGGVGFCYSAFSGEAIEYKTLVQSIILIAMGGGGLAVSLQHDRAEAR